MTASSQQPASTDCRRIGMNWAAKAQERLGEAEAGSSQQVDEFTGLAQTAALMAIYCELRHGHDQHALNTKTMRELTDVLDMLPSRPEGR